MKTSKFDIRTARVNVGPTTLNKPIIRLRLVCFLFMVLIDKGEQ